MIIPVLFFKIGGTKDDAIGRPFSGCPVTKHPLIIEEDTVHVVVPSQHLIHPLVHLDAECIMPSFLHMQEKKIIYTDEKIPFSIWTVFE